MKHWAIIDRATGEHSFAITADDQHPRDCGYAAKGHRFVALDRQPREHDRFDGKRLVECQDTRLRIDGHAALNRMSRAEFLDHVLATIRAEFAVLNNR